MDRWHGKLAIVTGASSGIGYAISEELVKKGLQVVGLARRVDRVEALARTLEGQPGKLHARKTDITKESELLESLKWAAEKFGVAHILINNAGVARPVDLITGSSEDFRLVIETNLISVAIGTREVVQKMLEGKVEGHILNINSICGHYVPMLPLNNMYPASKHAITGFTETLRQELFQRGSKIKVTSVSPGYVKTEIGSANGFFDLKEIKELEESAPYLESKDVADAVIYVLGTPQHVQVTELTIRPTGEPV
ncbi:PREDICTED: farnesol dehydrogenase-like [Nicrophorus vespilloides]|uniref:Farnesol dehydrogenase-like n=1 Tax=Nicrophorus vespilloides TaxID=110193 RepID=A0ABM1MS37_NICVS|nr:PREDICTED: farnesol dehydrogenase-like [Nicrophorus vespilloides]